MNPLCKISLITILLGGSLAAATLPANFAETQIASGLDPTGLTIAPDGRIFVCEKAGRIRIIQNGVLLATPFATLAVNNSNERGLQSVAFDPNFATNNYIYVFYTSSVAPVRNRVSRFTANGNVVSAGSELILIQTDNLDGSVHNGGAMYFWNGHLYIATGEAGNASNSQNMAKKLGKILRINPDGSIPASNPFVGQAGVDPSIWAYGLRNPFGAAIQPGTGRFFINDVGGGSWEEINVGAAGADYGWPISEGMSSDPDHSDPFFAYAHDSSTFGGCAITGAAFYNPAISNFPASYIGRYFFADYCNGKISSIDPANASDVAVFATGVNRCIDIDVAADGALYYTARAGMGGGSQQDNTSTTNGAIYRVVFTGSQVPTIAAQPQSVTVPVGETVTFNVAASGSQPFTYEWFRNDMLISGQTSATLTYGPVVIGENNSTIRCVVTNTFGFATTTDAILTVTSNTRPVPEILTPAADLPYRGGMVLNFSGSATDAQDGALPASAYSWKIDFHHDTHTHPAMGSTGGITAGTYTVDNTGETATDVWYRIYLTVTDSGGLSRTVFRDIFPQLSEMTFTTVPAGLAVALDGVSQTTPFVVSGVVGINRQLSVGSPQFLVDTAYRFDSWSQGGANAQTLVTPENNTTYTASFGVAPSDVGTGLRGEYFTNQNKTFNGAATLVRNGEVVDFDWGNGSPAPSISNDTFTARWTGQVQPQFTEAHTFYTTSDDGVRLWVDDQLIIDQWIDQGPTTWSGTVSLIAGSRYAVRLEFYEAGGGALAKLEWSSARTPRVIMPRERLFPTSINVSVIAEDSSARESTADSAAWRISRSGPLDQPITVNFTTSGTATPLVDYSITSAATSVVIPANQASVLITLTALADALAEGQETRTLTLAPGVGYGLAAPLSATITLADSPYAAWAIGAFGSLVNAQLAKAAPSGDWDGDGIMNLMEFALGLSPTIASQLGMPAMTMESETPVFTFKRPRPIPAGISYRVTHSLDLDTAQPWDEALILSGFPLNNGDGTEILKATIPRPGAMPPRAFMRLEVFQNP